MKIYQICFVFIQSLTLSNIHKMVPDRFFKLSLSYHIINHNHRKSIRLTIPYRIPIHNNNCMITINQHIPNPKLMSISCQSSCLNLIIFLSNQLHNAANQHIKYIHKENNNMVLNMVIKFQNHIGSHFI